MSEHSSILNGVKEVLSPQFCVLEILEKCMLRCKMCGNWKCGDNPYELDIDEWKKFIIDMRDKIGTKVELNFTGGEPLMKKGIMDLVSFAAGLGFKVIMVTNAYLIDEDMARLIAFSGLSDLAISLDSLKEETHDFIRGKSGTYSRVMKAIDYLARFKKDNLWLGLQTIIMKKNLDDIIELAQWVQQDSRLGDIYFQAIVQPNFASGGSEWFNDNQWYKRSDFSFLWPDDTPKVLAVIDELIRFKKEGYKISNPCGQLEAFKVYFSQPEEFNQRIRCRKGNHIFSVSPRGDIHLCHIYGSLGNVKNSDINMREIWNSQMAIQTRQKMNSCSQYCGPLVNCYFEE
jgi:MoaA/NifB/PqqE/SkfB family radical SAM enzyme